MSSDYLLSSSLKSHIKRRLFPLKGELSGVRRQLVLDGFLSAARAFSLWPGLPKKGSFAREQQCTMNIWLASSLFTSPPASLDDALWCQTALTCTGVGLSAVPGTIHSFHVGHLLSIYSVLDTRIQKERMCSKSLGAIPADGQTPAQRFEEPCTRGGRPGMSQGKGRETY